MRVSILLSAAVVLHLAGCSRAHLSPSHGRASREAYTLQQAAHPKGRAEPSMALDTQEAAAISRGYVRSLSGKGDAAEPAPVVLVAPARPGQAQPLAPSVPKP